MKAIEQLKTHQTQLDQDGVMVGVSRQALDEALAAVEQALTMAHYGSTDGAHHKDWVIDQMVRALTGDGYEAWVTEHKAGDEGPESYEWNCGIAP